MRGDLVRPGCRRAAARSSSRPCARARAPPRPRRVSVSSRSRRSSSAKPTSGCMISTSGGSPGRACDRQRRPGDRADLHLVDLRVDEPEPAAAQCRASGSPRGARGSVPASARRSPAPRAAGTRAAAGRAAGSSPAGPTSPRRCPRSRPAGTGSSRSSAARRPASSSARIISCITGSRSSPKNMCSVRQRPIPSAPNSRARDGVGRRCRRSRAPASRRNPSAQPRIVSKSSFSCGGTSSIRADDRPCRCRRRS